METFLKEIIEENKFELLIDSNIFNKDIILKAAYNFLDKGYFFFKFDNDNNIILQFTKKEDINEDTKIIILNFSDELLSVYLRDKLEKENKKIRENIVSAAISNSVDDKGYVELNTDLNEDNQIDFDKDIEEILKEIENDPDLKIDEEEIDKILKEIEEESKEEDCDIQIDFEALEEQKNKFKN